MTLAVVLLIGCDNGSAYTVWGGGGVTIDVVAEGDGPALTGAVPGYEPDVSPDEVDCDGAGGAWLTEINDTRSYRICGVFPTGSDGFTVTGLGDIAEVAVEIEIATDSTLGMINAYSPDRQTWLFEPDDAPQDLSGTGGTVEFSGRWSDYVDAEGPLQFTVTWEIDPAVVVEGRTSGSSTCVLCGIDFG